MNIYKRVNGLDGILSYKKKCSKYAVLLSSLLVVAILGVVDLLIGHEISFSFFYLIPISITVLLSGFRASILISVASALSWYFADDLGGHMYSHSLIPCWNAVMRFGYFILHSFLLDRMVLLYEKTKIDSLTDPLTGAVHSRFFRELFSHELNRAKRTGEPFSLVYFDLDNFKRINDMHGHGAGDVLLQTVAEIARGIIRSSDVFARMGGDEFALLFPDTGYDASSMMISRIVGAIHAEMEENGWPVTVSAGAVTCTVFEYDVDQLIQRADGLMYKVKQKGKNGVDHIIIEQAE